MSKFFPSHQNIKVSNIDIVAFQCQDIVFQFAYIAPRACFPLHQHPESQMGMVISGNLEMNVNGKKEILKPLQQVYSAGSEVPHGSVNYSDESIFCFDVKGLTNFSTDEAVFIDLKPTSDQITNFPSHIAVGSWFTTIITQIPPGEKTSNQQSDSEEIGVIIDGKMMVNIGGEQQEIKRGEIYYAPADVIHSGYNSASETVTLIKIVLPHHS
ncbi:cupin domain-containing protein [Aphanizomenon flos-aquae NRERC-008]|uniref:Cupin domain-containing protein n=1 Tax=Aphanizomenon flos-aquae FACHB-1249 TaxID=2692889 RepID=A0ABR8IR45_APHFL|nr:MULTISPECIES: cupin domain-containing protein [Aphanizomenon]MBD2389853.1 cupin domain-containing protein [Aphanizomenon flos-aquae FACHB-1171]MBD2556763.1 cupin domain-containing protein [Aphanizomenon flos-aquae FACHB-1290]MBD2631221.1 cupin domain-containing protein [Aphanizomenon sp. FACHB-1399]MBD2642352.1 cupin domain-containing protein [Aphanizomenon sp. FACHB-1401]MBD2656921.1 cupin domain-containing protein [Aphanizomenon flos-aquae FACHB-1265]